MATHDYVIDNSTGANVRADINNVLLAIASNNSNSSSPTTTYAYQWWADTTTGTLKIRNAANNAWVELLQLDGTLTLEDGSASTPALAFRDDLNTGIFQPGNNQVGISCNGTEVVEFGTSEAVFNDTGADINFRIEGDTKTNLFYVDAGNDRVAINTNTPIATFEIYDGTFCLTKPSSNSSSRNWRFLADNAAAGNLGLQVSTAAGGSTFSNVLEIDSSGKVLIGATSSAAGQLIVKDTTNAGNQIWIIGRASNDTSSVSFRNNADDAYVARIQADTANDLQFQVDGSERLRIDSSGKVGIATTSANEKLEVAGAINFTGAATSNQASCGKLSFESGTAFLQSRGADTSTRGKIGFNIAHSDGSSGITAMTVNTSGNVGIGLASATGKFAVSDGTVTAEINPFTSSGGAFIGTRSNHAVLFKTNASERGRIDTSGNFLVACTTTDSNASTGIRLLEVGSVHSTRSNEYAYVGARWDSDGGLFLFRRGTTNVGSISVTSSATAYNTSSDYRLKENVIPISDGITRLKTLKPSRFNFKNEPSKTVDGFLAHEVTAVPEAVTGTKDAVATEDTEEAKKGEPLYQVMDYGRITPLLTAALQEAISKIEVLETKVAALESA